jgi:integrase
VDLIARTETPESRTFQRDEAARVKHAQGAVRAFRALLQEIVPVADQAKAAFPGKDEQSLDRRARAFVKLARENETIQKYLDTWIGKEDVDPAAYSWRNTVTYAMRDVLVRGAPLKKALEVVGKYAQGSYQAMTMYEVQAPIREALPQDVMAFLPKTVVVKVDPKGKITQVTDRFKNEYFTLAKKAEQLRNILKNYNAIARTVKADLKSTDEVTRLSALVTSIIMETGIRPGKIGNGVVKTVDGEEEFVETFGAATLGPEHIRFVRDNFARIEFKGKKGGANTATLEDKDILKVLREYVTKALKAGSPYVFVTRKGEPYDYRDLDRYFDQKFAGINPTDFRKLRATEEVLNAIIEEQAGLYERLRKLKKLKKDDLKQAIVDEVVVTLQRAIERSQSALSHESEKTTIESYIHPGVLFRFLSTGRLDSNLSDLLATGKTELKFDPEAFLRAAMGGVPSAKRVAAQFLMST